LPNTELNAPHELNAATASRRIAEGTLNAETLARACVDRIASRDPTIRAWSYHDQAAVLRRARELDKQPVRGPLHGIPIAIKDVIETRDMPTGYNSPLLEGHQAGQDAPCVDTLRAAGAVIFGKTDTTEFAAAGRHAGTANPHNPAHSPGGSSSGSAAAVADHQVPLALGTQTGGSLIRPASYCGVFALKPSWGVVSREGSKLYSATFDTIGWYGRAVADLELLADVFDLNDDTKPLRHGLAGRRFAVCRPFPGDTLAASNDALTQAAEILRAAGAEIVPLDLPPAFSTLNDVHKVILFSEGRAAFLNLYRTHYEALHDDFRHRVENRDGITKAALRHAYDTAATCRIRFDEIASAFDAVLAPSAPGEATPGREPGKPLLNQIWSLLHVPCVNVPGFRGPAGMPVGVTLTGPRFTDRAMLVVAELVAAAFAAAGLDVPGRYLPENGPTMPV
jgi:Asp-tRNA(Asn)/Glu-tRNA(Gln) amidotransferase A subunit family amidase